MKRFLGVFAICILLAFNASAQTTRYVNINNATPVFPYTNWTMAATNIQDAVTSLPTNLSYTILVTNGVYSNGWVIRSGDYSNIWAKSRIQITNDNVRLMSVNGPEVTIIRGSRHNEEGGLSDTNLFGSNSIRCIRITLKTNVVISGFTLENGSTSTNPPFSFSFQMQTYGSAVYNGVYGGSAVRTVIENCIIQSNFSSSSFSGTSALNIGNTSLVKNCTLRYNYIQGSGSPLNGGGNIIYENSHITLHTNPSRQLLDNILYITNCLVDYNVIGHGVNTFSVRIAYNSTIAYNKVDSSAILINTGINVNIIGNTGTTRIVGGYISSQPAGNAQLRNSLVKDNVLASSSSLILGEVYNTYFINNTSTYFSVGTANGTSRVYNATLINNRLGLNWISTSTSNRLYIYNSILYSNSHPIAANFDTNLFIGNYTNANQDIANLLLGYTSGDYRLKRNSPAINYGSNLYVVNNLSDYYSTPRIQGGIVDAGASEYFEAPVSLPYGDWELLYNGLKAVFPLKTKANVESIRIDLSTFPTNNTDLITGEVWRDGDILRIME